VTTSPDRAARPADEGSADLAPRRTPVLSVVGPGRSGTTLVGNILGEVPGIVNAGEMRWLWQRGLLERRPCGCGRPPVECPRWSAVLGALWEEEAAALPREGSSPAVEEILTAQREVLARRRRLRVLSSAAGGGTDWASLRTMREASAGLCSSLAELTGARLVVDTSKLPAVAAVLAGAEGLDCYVLQMVRDPRAVAFSWQRPKPLPLAGGMGTMATAGTVTSTGFWMESCLGAELLRRHVPDDRWFLLRYEDFVARPRASIEGLLAFLGFPPDGPFLSDDTVSLGTNHTLAGNPDRFRTGRIRIRADDEWRAGLPRREGALVTAMTLPLLRRHGYPVRPPRTAR
jgi:hypothetical protein